MQVTTLLEATDDLEQLYLSGIDDIDYLEERRAYYLPRAERVRRARTVLERAL